MDDFYSDDFEGVLDHDLHRDLDSQLGNNYNDGPFAALPHPRTHSDFDISSHHDYDVEYGGDSEHDTDIGGIAFDGRSVSSDGFSRHSDAHRYESSEPESVESVASGGSLGSHIASESRDGHDDSASGDDSADEERDEARLEAAGSPFYGLHQISDEESAFGYEEDHRSLPGSEEELGIFDHDRAYQHSEDGEGYPNSESDEVQHHINNWDDERAEAGYLSGDELYADFTHIRDVNLDGHSHEIDYISDDPSNFHDESDSELEGQSSHNHSSNELSSSHIYSDDEDVSISGHSDSSRLRPSSSTTPSERSLPPLRRHLGEFLNDHPPELNSIYEQLEDEHQEHLRLAEDRRHLRGGRYGIADPVQGPNAPNRLERLLDRLPAPQRNAHGLLARMEMDLERGRQRRRAAPSPIRAPARLRQEMEPAFIDLTGDADSPPPEVLILPDAPRFAGRSRSRSRGREANPFAPRPPTRNNPRRHNTVRRTPSFARSDGSLLGPGGAPVIDLTNEPDVAPPPRAIPPPPRRLRDPPNNPVPPPRNRVDLFNRAGEMDAFFRQIRIAGVNQVADFLHRVGVGFGHGQRDYEVEFIGENRRMPVANFPIMENPLADNPVDFNYGANGFNQEPARPKPVHIAPPESREGFTRNTGEDTVVICPSCEEELKYDPDDNEAQPPPAKKARTTKKDREEHHFWAVKACGHVYCRSCYENRRPSARNPNKTAFQQVERKILCAVEDCSSDVSTKTAWVGIFL